MIERSNPEVGYMASDVFKAYGFTQAIKVGNTLYLSGTAPFRGDAKKLELVGEGDLRAQAEWTLEVIKRCLAAYGADFRHWVAQTVYTTDIAALARTVDLFARYFGEHTPTSTWVEVKGLFNPKQMIEISGIAVIE